MKWFGVVSACVAFVLIGALQALYGPALSAFRADFGISVPAAGLALSAHFVGGIAGVLGYARSPWPGTGKLAASLVAMAAGAAGVALAPTWPLALVAAFVAGVGFGGIDYGCNDMFARAFQRRGSAMLNVLNAHFGVGAIAGPLLIGLLGPDRYPAIFLGFAAVSLLLLAGLRGTAEAPTAEPAPPPPRRASGNEGCWPRSSCST
ncbi:MFS transporter [Phytohabitans rumicis]|uniref:Major facilitator superfamily (MFS) profile domain-containing protein n=1 Tax=Phytohabitans rumicis TaxID=1076125 RepID=A0A6V8LER0_9ACTN|nr:MFS transporter [Phytohabitans rumicis]GFJ94150.1 hypothetical protein Prum_077920 [Phytohabitans rumicis]